MRCQNTHTNKRPYKWWSVILAGVLFISSLGCTLATHLGSQLLPERPVEVNIRRLPRFTRTPLPPLAMENGSLSTGAAPPQITVTLVVPTPAAPPVTAPAWTPTTPASATPALVVATVPASQARSAYSTVPENTRMAVRQPSPTPTPRSGASAPPSSPAVSPSPLAPPVQLAAAPTSPPAPTLTPTPSFAYQAVEVYKDHTANSFLTGYIAIVNDQEIPIGGLKAVGDFAPGGAHYESPLSNWFFDGQTAPGAVTKESSVKFEPPGAVESGTWFIHLEDEGGTRLSADTTVSTDPNNVEWFYIKFKQPGTGQANPATATPLYAANPSATPLGTPIAGAATLTPTPTWTPNVPAGPGPSLPTATKVPTPTPPPATPQTALTAGWETTNIQLVPQPDDDSLTVLGNLVNNTGSDQQVMVVTGTFFDAEEQALTGPYDLYDYWPVEIVPAEGQVPFELTGYGLTDATQIEVGVISQASGQTPRQDFALSDVNSDNEAGTYCLNGSLGNQGDALQDYLLVVGTLYNSQDQVINFDSDEASDPEEITVENTFDFEICLDTLGQDVARHEIKAFGE